MHGMIGCFGSPTSAGSWDRGSSSGHSPRAGRSYSWRAHPTHPAADRLWSLVERHGVTILGVSPTLVRALMRHGAGPVRHTISPACAILASTGEPWDPESWRWLFENAGVSRCPIINSRAGPSSGAVPVLAHSHHAAQAMLAGRASLGIAVDVYDAPANRSGTASASWSAPSLGRE